VDSSSDADSVDRHAPIVQATDNPDRRDVCPRSDPDTRDELVSLSQSTEVTVAEAGKDAINPQSDTLPVAINSPQPVRQFPDGIQYRPLIGRKSTRACVERQVNSVFVSGPRARVVVVEGGRAFVDCGCCRKSCCEAIMPRRRHTSPASSRDSDSDDSESGGEAGTASSPTVGLPMGGSDELSVPPMAVDTAGLSGSPAPDATGARLDGRF